MKRLCLLTAVLLAFHPLAASGQELVLNGDFELPGGGGGEGRGGPLHYQPMGGGGPSPFDFWLSEGQAMLTGDLAHSGTISAAFGSVGSTATMYQDIPTTAGEQYTFSFWLALDGLGEGTGVETFLARFDGVDVYSRSDNDFPGLIPYQFFSFVVTATGPTTRVEFVGQNDPGYYFLDDVSVQPVTAVPEPGTYAAAALAASLVGTTFWRRRRR